MLQMSPMLAKLYIWWKIYIVCSFRWLPIRFRIFILNILGWKLKLKVGKRVYLGKMAEITMFEKSKIIIGDHVKLGNLLRITAYSRSELSIGAECKLGEFVRFTVGKDSTLSLGDKTRFTQGCILRSGDEHKLIVGSMVTVGEYTSIRGTDHEFKKEGIPILEQGSWSKDVVIEDDVWIGSRVMIMPGITIGSHSIIAASAVVTKSVPTNSVAKGIPAKISEIQREKD